MEKEKKNRESVVMDTICDGMKNDFIYAKHTLLILIGLQEALLRILLIVYLQYFYWVVAFVSCA